MAFVTRRFIMSSCISRKSSTLDVASTNLVMLFYSINSNLSAIKKSVSNISSNKCLKLLFNDVKFWIILLLLRLILKYNKYYKWTVLTVSRLAPICNDTYNFCWGKKAFAHNPLIWIKNWLVPKLMLFINAAKLLSVLLLLDRP